MEWNHIALGYAPGTNLTKAFMEPYVNVTYSGASRVEFYKGETGDTNELVQATNQYLAAPGWPVKTFFLKNFVITETMRLWARAYGSSGHIDSESRELRVVDPDAITLVDWPAAISQVDRGVKILLQPKLSEEAVGVSAKWYWGESGDTTRPAGANFLGVTNAIEVRVPDDPTPIWVRLTIGNRVLDSPASIIKPLPVAPPRIINQPDDMVVYWPAGTEGLVWPGINAVGGHLFFQWFLGEPGDTTRPISYSLHPGDYGNLHQFGLQIPYSESSAFLMVWNTAGVTTSRKVNFYKPRAEDLRILEYPHIIHLRKTDVDQAASGFRFDLFWLQFSGLPDKAELFFLNGEWTKFLEVKNLSGTDEPNIAYVHVPADMQQTLAETWPARSYCRMRLWSGTTYVDTEPILFVNEYKFRPANPATPAAWPVVPASLHTNGGLFEARVAVTRKVAYESIKVFAGRPGDRSLPLAFTTSHRDFRREGANNFGYWNFTISWEPNGESTYWMEAYTHEGVPVRCILRYPFQEDGTFSNVVSVVLPSGAEDIPLPQIGNLPGAPAWRIGASTPDGLQVALPLELPDLMQFNTDVTLWGDGEVVGQIGVDVSDTLPPQIETVPAVAAVQPDGRVFWTASVNGEVTATSIYWMQKGGSWQLLEHLHGKLNHGVILPAEADLVKTVYHMDDRSSEAAYWVTRIPQQAFDALRVKRAFRDTLYSEHMGSFLNTRYYPWLQHAELGWIYVYPTGSSFFFWGKTDNQDYSWNWVHSDYFPYLYNYQTQSWKYYHINSYGWFHDVESGDLYRVGG